MNIFEITLPATSHATLLESVCCDLTRDQRLIVEGIVNELQPLFEAELTTDQINQIFAQAEQNLSGIGVNRSGIGKTVDLTKAAGNKVNNAINKLGGYLQTTAPVQYFDQKFEDLKQKISAKLGADSKTMAVIDQLGQYAKANPSKTAFVIGALTAVASFAAGPAGGAVAGQVLRGATELLKGEKLSTAVGRGAKSAALGALAGAGAKQLGDMLSGTVQAVADQLHPGVNQLKLNWSNLGGTVAKIDVHGLPQDIKPIQTAWRQAWAAYKSGDINTAAKYLTYVDQLVDKISTPEYISKLSTEIADQQKWQAGANAFKKVVDTAVAATQGAVTATTAKTPAAQPAAQPATAAPANFNQVREHRIRLTNTEIREIFAVAGCQIVAEGPMDWIRTKGKNITTRVTADKLNKLWSKAGKPTGSDQIAVILKQAEVPDTVISSAFDSVGVSVPSFVTNPTQSVTAKTAAQPSAKPAQKTAPTEPALEKEPDQKIEPTAASAASSKYSSPIQVVDAIMDTMPKAWLPEITAELLKRQRVSATKR